MAVIDLGTRLTNNWEAYHNNLKSSDSLIFVEPGNYIIDDGPSSLDLIAGDKCFIQGSESHLLIPADGAILQPFSSLLIETAQKISLPLNVFGFVIGKGSQIYQGTFISSGKINPGFSGKLKIGLYNGTKKKILIKSGDPLCSCVFFEMESSMTNPLKNYDSNSKPTKSFLSKKQKIAIWLREHNNTIIAITAIVALIVALLAIFLDKDFIGYQNSQK